MSRITRIDQALLDEVCAEAAASPRRRKNRNFHHDNAQPAHRLLNAMMMDSYIPPHRHLDPHKDETMVLLRGEMAVIEFDDAGTIIEVTKLSPGGMASPLGTASVVGIDIPHGVWHTVVALADNTVFLEAKAGPYAMLSPDEKPSWAPSENDPVAAAYLVHLREQLVSAA